MRSVSSARAATDRGGSRAHAVRARPGAARLRRAARGRARGGRRPRAVGVRAPGDVRRAAAARTSRPRRCAATVGGALVELELHQRARLEQRLCLGRVGLEHGDPHLERGDALDVGGALRLQRVLLGCDRRELHLALRTLGVHARSGPLDAVELVDGAPLGFGGGSFVAPTGVEVERARASSVSRTTTRTSSDLLGASRASSSAARVAASASPPRRHEPRPPKRSPRSVTTVSDGSRSTRSSAA